MSQHEIVVSRVEYDGIVVTCDPPARFVAALMAEVGRPWLEEPFWGVAENEFLLSPRGASLDDLRRACESALWNLGAVVLGDGLSDVLSDPGRAVLVPARLLERAPALRQRLHVSRP